LTIIGIYGIIESESLSNIVCLEEDQLWNLLES